MLVSTVVRSPEDCQGTRVARPPEDLPHQPLVCHGWRDGVQPHQRPANHETAYVYQNDAGNIQGSC